MTHVPLWIRMALVSYLIVGQVWMLCFYVSVKLDGSYKASQWREIPNILGGLMLAILARLFFWPVYALRVIWERPR